MRRIFAVCVGLCLLIVIGTALQGQARFTDPQWAIDDPLRQSMPPATFTGSTADPSTAPAPPHTGAVIDPALIYGLLAVLAAALITYVILRLRQRRPRRFSALLADADVGTPSDAAGTPSPDAELPTQIRRGIAHALAQLSDDRPSGDAIIAAWIGLQQSAEDSGIVRLPSETAAEFTAAAISRFGGEADVRELLRLYQDVRFGGHAATRHDVQRAQQKLESLRKVWS